MKFLFLVHLLFASTALAALDGTYLMKLKIGEKIFDDILVLEGVNGPIDYYSRGPLKGSVTVSNAFSVPLAGNVSCSVWIGICNLDFEITAVENGNSFKVFYSGEYTLAQSFTGSAHLENGDLLGTFEATRIKK